MKYAIEIHPCFSPISFSGSYPEVLEAADKAIEYNTKDLRVFDEKGKEFARRRWHLVGMGNFNVPAGGIRLCDGYYGPWEFSKEAQNG